MKIFFLLLYLLVAGCSDSDSINTLILPEQTSVAQGIIAETAGFSVINIPSPENPKLAVTSLTNRKTGLSRYMFLDTDDASSRELEDGYPNDLGALPEFAIYTYAENEGELFLLDLKSQKEQLIFDFSLTNSPIICGLQANKIPIFESLVNGLVELKNELKFSVFVSDESCAGNNDNSYYYQLTLTPASNNQYTVSQYTVINENEDADIEPQYKLSDVRYPYYRTEKRTIPNELAASRILVVDGDQESYGYVGLDEQDNSFNFFLPRSTTETELYLAWTVPANSDLSVENKWEKDLSNSQLNEGLLIIDKSLIRIDKSDMLNISNSVARTQALNNPIFTWKNELSPSSTANVSRIPGMLVVLDGNELWLIDSNNNKSLLRSLPSELSYSLYNDYRDINLTKIKDDSLYSLSRINPTTGAEKLLLASMSFYQITAGGYTSFAGTPSPNLEHGLYSQIFENGQAALQPPLKNTLWLPMFDYRSRSLTYYRLISDIQTSEALVSPQIYTFDRTAPYEEGFFQGAVNGDIAQVIASVILSKDFGMVWAVPSRNSENIEAYSFIPSNDEWQLTKISSDAVIPFWIQPAS